MKNLLLGLLTITLLVLSTSCNANSNTALPNKNIAHNDEDTLIVENNVQDNVNETETSQIEPIDDLAQTDRSTYFNYDDAIELRDSNLWLNKQDLNRLVLDGEIYDIDDKLITTDDFSHVIISYPLIVLGGDIVYDLEKSNQLISLNELIKGLEKVWGSEVAIDGYTWYGDTSLEPKNFTFIDYIQYSTNEEMVCIAMHSFLADVFDSIVCTYDLESDTLKFIADPFHGQVIDIDFSDNNATIAYSYNTGGESELNYIDIIDSEAMALINRIDLSELLALEDDYRDSDQSRVQLKGTFWDENKLIAELEICALESSDDDIENTTLEIWSID